MIYRIEPRGGFHTLRVRKRAESIVYGLSTAPLIVVPRAKPLLFVSTSMSVYASPQQRAYAAVKAGAGGEGTFALKHITQSDATKQHWRLPHLTMPQRQSNMCLALAC